jgi:hypothetical protein
MNKFRTAVLIALSLVVGGAVAWTARPEAVSIPTVYVGEMANNEVLHVPMEFYVDGHDLNPSFDVLAPFDFVNLTPEIARRIPASQPHNGFSFAPIPGAVGLAQVKVIYGNSVGVYEKIVEVRVVPAGSITLHVEDARYSPDLYTTYE